MKAKRANKFEPWLQTKYNSVFANCVVIIGFYVDFEKKTV